MNLENLFKMQNALRQRIISNHDLGEKDLLPNFILALQVELGELANAWRGFKHWSFNKTMHLDAALEEYADCLSFILEIGIELKAPQIVTMRDAFKARSSITHQFNEVFLSVGDLEINLPHRLDRKEAAVDQYNDLFMNFIILGQMLGFSWEEVERAYIRKNEINHTRQAEGY